MKQREAKQLETVQPFDKALKCGCFSNIKKFQGSLGKKWGHAKRVQKSDILTTRGFIPCGIGLSKLLMCIILKLFQRVSSLELLQSVNAFPKDWRTLDFIEVMKFRVPIFRWSNFTIKYDAQLKQAF